MTRNRPLSRLREAEPPKNRVSSIRGGGELAHGRQSAGRPAAGPPPVEAYWRHSPDCDCYRCRWW